VQDSSHSQPTGKSPGMFPGHLTGQQQMCNQTWGSSSLMMLQPRRMICSSPKTAGPVPPPQGPPDQPYLTLQRPDWGPNQCRCMWRVQ
jgi:hypothetical protein